MTGNCSRALIESISDRVKELDSNQVAQRLATVDDCSRFLDRTSGFGKLLFALSGPTPPVARSFLSDDARNCHDRKLRDSFRYGGLHRQYSKSLEGINGGRGTTRSMRKTNSTHSLGSSMTEHRLPMRGDVLIDTLLDKFVADRKRRKHVRRRIYGAFAVVIGLVTLLTTTVSIWNALKTGDQPPLQHSDSAGRGAFDRLKLEVGALFKKLGVIMETQKHGVVERLKLEIAALTKKLDGITESQTSNGWRGPKSGAVFDKIKAAVEQRQDTNVRMCPGSAGVLQPCGGQSDQPTMCAGSAGVPQPCGN